MTDLVVVCDLAFFGHERARTSINRQPPTWLDRVAIAVGPWELPVDDPNSNRPIHADPSSTQDRRQRYEHLGNPCVSKTWEPPLPTVSYPCWSMVADWRARATSISHECAVSSG